MVRWLVVLILALTPAAWAQVASAPSNVAGDGPVQFKLRARVETQNDTLTLGDVLVAVSDDADLTQRVLAASALPAPLVPGTNYLTYQQVVGRLNELGVNLGRVLLGGAAVCEIRFQKPAPPRTESAEKQRPSAAARAGPSETPAPAGARTLADVLREYVAAQVRALGGTAEIEFERGGQDLLSLTTPPWEFHVSSSSPTRLGLREFRVVIRQNGQTQRTVEVAGRVTLACPAVVARRPLSIGNTVRADDVQLETRVFDRDDRLGLTELERVIGQQVKRFVPAGDLVSADALKPVDLVQRSRPVTVLGASDRVQVRLTGTALDSGTWGDSVRVRLGEAPRGRQVVRAVVTGLGTVRVTEEMP